MDLFTLTLLSISVYILHHYFKQHLAYFEEHGVPYVPAWPLLGNMSAHFFRREHISRTIARLYNAHPEAKYIGVFDFHCPVIMIRDPRLVKSIATSFFEHCPDHKIVEDEALDPLFSRNLFAMRGDKWRDARDLLSRAFSLGKMRVVHDLVAECARNFVDHLDQLPDDSMRRMLETRDLFAKFTTDSVAAFAFGVSVDSFKNPRNDFYVLGKEAVASECPTWKLFLARFFPAAMKRLNIRFLSERVAEFFAKVVRNMVKTRQRTGMSRPDIIQLMMNNNNNLDMTEMTAQAFIFFFGGFNITSKHMCAMAHELAVNPAVQRRLQAEIDRVMARCGGEPTYDDVQAMQYLDAVFRESCRMHTVVPLLDRVCAKPLELPPSLPGGKPFVLLPGTSVWLPSTAIHKDPRYYAKPEAFDPDRYYERRVSLGDETNLGFGIGPRRCIAERFTVMEIKLMFFYVLSRFNLRANERTASPLMYSSGEWTVNAENGYWLDIEKRERE